MYQLQFPVKKFVKKQVLTVEEKATLKELIETFRRSNNHFAIILREKRPVGIITERDILKALFSNYPLNAPITPLIKRDLIKIEENNTVLKAFQLMTENFIRRLVVVDAEGYFKGVFTQEDFIKLSETEIFRGEGKVRDLVESKSMDLIYATSDEIVKSVLSKMSMYNVGAIPILDENKHPIGIITERDIMNLESNDLDKKVVEIGKKRVITIKMNEPILKAVNLFKEHGIRHLLVVDNEGKAIQILSQRDMIDNLSQTYAEFLEESLINFKKFINLIPEIVLELTDCSRECKITWMNEFAKNNLGEDYLNKEIYYLFDSKVWDRVYGALLKSRSLYKEIIKDNKGRTYEISATYIDVGKREAKIKIFLKDLTSYLQKEEEFQRELRFLKTFLDNSLDLIFVIDENGNIVFANESFKKFLGYTDDDLQNLKIYDIALLSPEELKKNIDLIFSKGLTIEGERKYKDKYGNIYTVEIKAKGVVINSCKLIIINAREISKVLVVREKYEKQVKRHKEYLDFINKIGYLSEKEDLLKALEDTFLRYAEVFHLFEFDNEERRVLSTYLAGDKSCWEDCMQVEIEKCPVYKSGTPLIITTQGGCPQLPSPYYVVCLPILFEGMVQGVISLVRKTPFQEEEVKWFQDLIQFFSSRYHLVKLKTELEELSVKDPLLKIFNRRFIQILLDKEIKRIERHGGYFSILLSDLDNFKKVNDTYGHSIGDEVLKLFTKVVSSQIREMDVFARWGGEEFLVFLPKTTKEQAKIVAERIRKKLSESYLYIDESRKIKVTASFGVATFPDDGVTLDWLLKVADERLYKAKSLGKDCVVSD
jgi:diguanylate cyclase (GGDEF)-like protein/PAS domain S-box-containing protein